MEEAASQVNHVPLPTNIRNEAERYEEKTVRLKEIKGKPS